MVSAEEAKKKVAVANKKRFIRAGRGVEGEGVVGHKRKKVDITW